MPRPMRERTRRCVWHEDRCRFAGGPGLPPWPDEVVALLADLGKEPPEQEVDCRAPTERDRRNGVGVYAPTPDEPPHIDPRIVAMAEEIKREERSR